MWVLPSCVYYNTFYNAKTKYEQADLQRLEAEAEPENRVLANTYLDYYLFVIRKASSILELHPDSKWVDDSLLMIGKSYYWRGEHRDALQKFNELLGNFKGSELREEALYWKAIALWGNDEISNSRDLLKQIGQSGDGVYAWQARLALAELEQSQGNGQLAVRNYLSLVAEVEDGELKTRLFKGLGETYFTQKDYPNALNAYQMVLSTGPDDLTGYQARVRIGETQELMDDYEGAMRTYQLLEKAKRFRRFQPRVQLMIANVYRRIGQVDKAQATYEKVIKENQRTEESAEAYYQIALIEHQVRRNNEKTMELLATARKERSTSEAAVKALKLETTLFQLDKFKKRSAKETQKGTEALFNVAEIYLFSLGEVDSAISAYQQILARSGGTDVAAKALYGMGLIYADSLSNETQAAEYFQKLIDEYPVTPYAVDARKRIGGNRSDDLLAEARFIEAETLRNEGADTQEIITTLTQVTEEYPSSLYAPKALFALGWTYENDLGDLEKAAEQYEHLVDAYPMTDFAQISEDKSKLIKKELREKKRNEKKAAKEEEKEVKQGAVDEVKKTAAETSVTYTGEEKGIKKKAEPEKQAVTSQEENAPESEAAPKTPKPAPAIPTDGPLDAGQVDQLPTLVTAPPPEVREELMEEADMDPNVMVRMLVGKDGKVKRVIVISGNDLLNEAAVNAAFEYRFETGKHQGKPREVWMEFPITFVKPYADEEGEPQ
jgi:tetratricopeptide (TPR) repeat protein